MKRRIVPIFFVIVILALGAIYFLASRKVEKEEKIAQARVVVPLSSVDKKDDSISSPFNFEDSSLVSLIELKGDETLITTETLDFDGDGNDDQINVIKTVSSPYLQLLIGLYSSETNRIERLGVLATPVTQMRTFSYTGVDLVGDHRLALVYQGFDGDGNSILQASYINTNYDGSMNVDVIANLVGDGTIFVQEMDRSESYLQNESKGLSYPIWVYTSDFSNPESTDQIHKRYEWNSRTRKYEIAEEQLIKGSRLAAKELARIQDGTVETFAEFLNGMWYRTVGNKRYFLAFDWKERQVIFFLENEEGVFDWVSSNVRRNGMYISSTNLEIQNLRRNIDISLRNVDEIYVRINDDVRMIVSESSVWNGSYFKVDNSTFDYLTDAGDRKDRAYIIDLEDGPRWKLPDGTQIIFDGGKYRAFGDFSSDYGSYTSMESCGQPFIQMRSESSTPLFSKMYLISYGAPGEDSRRFNEDEIVLKPYNVTPDRAYPVEGRTFILARYDPDESYRESASVLDTELSD